METEQQEFWKKRLEKLKAENQSLRNQLTSLKREDNNLKKSLKNRNRLFDSIPAGIVLIQKGKIVDINKTALDRLGYSAEEVIDHDFLDFVHPDLKVTSKNLHKKRISRKVVPEHYETDLVTKDGETVSCYINIKRIRYNGRTAFVVNLISLEKRTEEEKENLRSKKMGALITMASGLTNEFSRYLEPIRENTKNIRTTANPENASLIEDLEKIENALNRALLTTEKLNSISKTVDDRSGMILLDPKKVVKDAVTLINQKWKDESERPDLKINLKTFLREVAPIQGNPREIKDVIINMILNAAEAMPEGGDIFITTEENAGYAHIYIQDSGEGISEQIRDRIFDPFFTTRGDNGIGLGLSLSYAIVKRHGGEIEVSSQKDQGTIFNIKFPIASQKPKSNAGSARRKIKDARILIIESEDIIRELLSQLLTTKGCRVVTADSGMEGLGILEKKKFDLIIADTENSEIDSAVLIKKIRKMNRDLPVALITEHEAGDKFSRLQRSSVDLFIKKPIDMNIVVKQVLEIMTGRY